MTRRLVTTPQHRLLPSPDRTLLTTTEVARELRLTPESVRLLIARGHLPAIRVGRRVLRVRKSDLLRWLDQRSIGR
ncbi:MAG: helix-turn-helix domain-containing protein, partial [Chloroflexi bacterium]|nr:helix-turn-helix domain-containing protein [Chloroflexota bacterium]